MRRRDPWLGRRQFLIGVGTGTASVGLAGCSGGSGGDGDGGDGGDGDTPTPTPTESPDGNVEVPDLDPAGDVVDPETRDRVDDFLADVGNYEGEVMDATGMDEVVVAVGAEGNQGNFAFEYPAIVVAAGTTVSWRWTGEGGQHNVVSRDPSDFEFDSGNPKVSGDPYERSFDEAGVGLYVCVPHESLQMRGAVVVSG